MNFHIMRSANGNETEKDAEAPLNSIKRISGEALEMKIIICIAMAIMLFLGLNYRQLYSAWAIQSEMKRLVILALSEPIEFQNPAPVEDDLDDTLSTDFWKFTTINGAGKVSNESAWHSAEVKLEGGLYIRHFPDPDFPSENVKLPNAPAAGQYNNVTLIGGSGFRPTPSNDVVLQFSSKVSENFYGTAGVIFQQVGTLRKDGIFVKPFDMFGFSIAGKESSVAGINGPFCYLALNWVPVQVESLQVDAQSLHTYEIRLRWISQTRWLGSVKVDDVEQCQISMPVFGPVEVHVWSDNALVAHRPRRWWEIAPSMDLKFQDGGNKEFDLGMIRIFGESR
jgi:hypothetical protein